MGERGTPDPHGRTENGRKNGEPTDHYWSIRPFGAHPPSGNMFFSLFESLSLRTFWIALAQALTWTWAKKIFKGEKSWIFFNPPQPLFATGFFCSKILKNWGVPYIFYIFDSDSNLLPAVFLRIFMDFLGPTDWKLSKYPADGTIASYFTNRDLPENSRSPISLPKSYLDTWIEMKKKTCFQSRAI